MTIYKVLFSLLVALFLSVGTAQAAMIGQISCTDTPGCCSSTEERHLTCSNGSDGEIVQTRTVYGQGRCGGASGWTTILNTCGCAEATSPTETVACTGGQVGEIKRNRTVNVGNVCGANSDWNILSNTCRAPTCQEAGNCPVDSCITRGDCPAMDIRIFDMNVDPLYAFGDRRGGNEASATYQGGPRYVCAKNGYSRVLNFSGAMGGTWKGKGDCGNSDITYYYAQFNGDVNNSASVLNLSNYFWKRELWTKDTNCTPRSMQVMCGKLSDAISPPLITSNYTQTSNPDSVPPPAGMSQCPADMDMRNLSDGKYFAKLNPNMQGGLKFNTINTAANLVGGGYMNTACRIRMKCYQRTVTPAAPVCLNEEWVEDMWMGYGYYQCNEWSDPSGQFDVFTGTLDCQ